MGTKIRRRACRHSTRILKRVSDGQHLSARRRGVCPVATPEGVGGVVSLAEPSAIGNISGYTPFMRGKAESSAKEGLGVPAPAFPHHTLTVAVWSGAGERRV